MFYVCIKLLLKSELSDKFSYKCDIYNIDKNKYILERFLVEKDRFLIIRLASSLFRSNTTASHKC